MSKKDLIDKKIPKLSATFRKFWGAPPLLGSESEDVYWSFAAAIVADIDPTDMVTLLLVKDFVDHSWQIRELRKHTGRLLDQQRATKFARLDPKDKKKVAPYYAGAVGETELFLLCMGSFGAIETLIADMEQRRNDVLAEIEFYREAVAMRRRRNAEAAMIEGQVIESAVDTTAESTAKSNGAPEATEVAVPSEAAAAPPGPQESADEPPVG